MSHREEIASCAEKSYQQLDRREATKMLFLDSEEDMDKIAESVRTENTIFL